MILHIINEMLPGEKSDALLQLAEELNYLNDELFHEYEPRSYTSFEDRLELWLANVEDPAERKAMFEMLSHIFFVARGQMNSLCRTAYNDPIMRWVIDNAGINIAADDASGELAGEMRRTWFCPMTDSMRINKFLKVNDIEGHKHRPDWRSLRDLGDATKIRAFVEKQGMKSLVLLEDFVGTGRQMTDAATFALETLPDLPILIVPLISCPEGAREGAKLQAAHELLQVRPVLVLVEPTSFIRKEAGSAEPPGFQILREMSSRYEGRFSSKFDDPFGHGDLGALTVLHTNCPDNALPLIFDDSEDWRALFPRVRRVDH